MSDKLFMVTFVLAMVWGAYTGIKGYSLATCLIGIIVINAVMWCF